VEHRAAFGRVDRISAQHRVAPLFDPALAREVEQEMQRRGVDAVLRQVGEDLRRLDAERVEAPRVAGEGIAQVEIAAMGFVVATECGPGFRLIAARVVHHKA